MQESLCTVEVLPHRRKLESKKDRNLMETLVENSIFLRADCGGKGVCGKCLVEVIDPGGGFTSTEACTCRVKDDMTIRIPETSLMSAHIISKAPTTLPRSFTRRFAQKHPDSVIPGIAVDLGTTTIALYLCDLQQGTVLSSVAVKNPQALYGDDVMSRIGEISRSADKLSILQQLVVRVIEWGTGELFKSCHLECSSLTQMAIVGNPTMIHILLGVSPCPIGIAPYQPQFFEARRSEATHLGFDFPGVTIDTLPQISGFIGGDILAAAMAVELEEEPVGTLLIDLGTNGELVLKGNDKFYATSCATGPAFEGATLSCGMQAIPGAIDRVFIDNGVNSPDYSVIQKNGITGTEPLGICGSGIISAVASFCRTGVVEKSGLFCRDKTILPLEESAAGGRRFVIAPANRGAAGKEISISQKDIRAVQLGKAALITGIEFLLRAAGMEAPAKIIVAGAFGSYLNKNDILTLGMVPPIDPKMIKIAGNAAGTGAIMALCDNRCLEEAGQIADRISVIDLAANIDFQNTFIQRLAFSDLYPRS